MNPSEIRRRFEYIPPTEAKRQVHDRMRQLVSTFATIIDALPGESREKALAITKLEEAAFWTHAHIARNIVSTGGVPLPPARLPFAGPLDEGVDLEPGDGAAEAEASDGSEDADGVEDSEHL